MILRLLEVWKSGVIMARMSFAILRHGKISSTSKGAAISHNHRLGNVDQVNIDKDMKHLNRCFMGEGLADRIDALLPEKIRKDAVVSIELLLTSGPEFFNEIENDRAKLSKNPRFLDWVQKTLDWAKKEFGGNLVDATLHMDESTPHMHLMAVPLTKDGRLCAKELMARPELQRRQTEYAKAMEPFGLKRGDPAAETKRRHIGLKENPSSGGKAAQLETQLAKVKADLARLQKLSKEWSDRDLAKIKAHEVTVAVALQERDSLAEELKAAKAEYKELHKKAVAIQNDRNSLAKEVETMGKALKLASEKDHEMVKELAELRKTKPKAPASPEILKAVDRILIDQASERLEKEAQKAQETLPAEWVGLPMANSLQVQHGTPRAIYGRQVVLSVGRGNHVIHTVPDGQPMPRLQQTEQQKSGISR